MIAKKNKKKLYIDFDGVIVDTIPLIMDLFKSKGLKTPYVEEEIRKILSKLDWYQLIDDSEIIEGSIEGINKLIEKNYDVTVLTHMNSLQELSAKINFLETNIINYTGLNIVGVPKIIPKFIMMDPIGNILVDDFTNNLIEWKNAGGIPIKFSKKKNKKFKTIDNLLDLLDISMQEEKKLDI